MPETDVIRTAVQAAVQIERSPDPKHAVEKAMSVARAVGIVMLNAVEKPADDRIGREHMLYAACQKSLSYFCGGYGWRDPFVARGLRAGETLSVAEVREQRLSAQERAALDYVETAGGYSDGLIVPVRHSVHPDGVVIFSGRNPDIGPASRAALTMLGHCVYARIYDLKHKRGAGAQVPPGLTDREREVLGWVAKGKCDSEIAVICGMSERTARFHVANAKTKLAVTSRVQAVTKALDLGLLAA